jgi:hypothetical protein
MPLGRPGVLPRMSEVGPLGGRPEPGVAAGWRQWGRRSSTEAPSRLLLAARSVMTHWSSWLLRVAIDEVAIG